MTTKIRLKQKDDFAAVHLGYKTTSVPFCHFQAVVFVLTDFGAFEKDHVGFLKRAETRGKWFNGCLVPTIALDQSRKEFQEF